MLALSLGVAGQTSLSTPVTSQRQCPAGVECSLEDVNASAPPATNRSGQCAPGTECFPEGAGSVPRTDLPAAGIPATPLGSETIPRHDGTGIQERKPRGLQLQETNEFQQFVTTDLGRQLPIFGADLFTDVPSTFAPIDRVPVSADYVIGPGDELLIRAWGQIDLNARITVDRSGNIYLPKVGTISVAGLKYQQIEGYLRASISRVFRNFDLNVGLGQLRSIQVFVVGQAKRPGTYTVSSLSTLVNAIFASGGPSSEGSMRHIQLKRGSQIVSDFDLYDLLQRGDKSKDTNLLPGDVIYIPPVGPLIAISGSVKQPAIYEMKDLMTLQDAILAAGGLATTASVERASIERINERRLRSVMEVSVTQNGATPMQDGDVVRVLPISPRFENTVTLRGNVAVPGRYAWREGMRVTDLIPTRETLIPRRFWQQQNSIVGSSESVPKNVDQTTIPVDQSIVRNDINWDYAAIQRTTPDDLSTNLIPFNLGKAIGDPNGESNLPLKAGDIVTIFSQSDVSVPIGKRARFVELAGEVRAPGLYRVEPGETLRQLVMRAGGLTNNAYLFGAVFTRESVRMEQQKRLDDYIDQLQQDLERSTVAASKAAISTDESTALSSRVESQRRLVERLRQTRASGRVVLQLTSAENTVDAFPSEFVLEDGDRLVIPARPATVNVVGAVYNPASFVQSRTKRARDYLRQAGGATRNADASRMFIIGPDGAVLSGAVSRRHVAELHLRAGSTIVVPEQLDKGSALRGVRDWSQVFAQFALGAAAIKVLSP